MANNPGFAATPKVGAASLSASAETSLTAPTIATTALFTAGSSGAKIDEIILHAVSNSLVPDPAAGNVYLFLHDGVSGVHLFDVISFGDPAAGSTTIAPFRTSRIYERLWMASGWNIRASRSTADATNLLKIIIIGADM